MSGTQCAAVATMPDALLAETPTMTTGIHAALGACFDATTDGRSAAAVANTDARRTAQVMGLSIFFKSATHGEVIRDGGRIREYEIKPTRDRQTKAVTRHAVLDGGDFHRKQSIGG